MLINIQLLRFFAAFAIVLFHAVPVFRLEEYGALFSWIRYFGFSGVDVFFVISGFIMWYTTHDRRGRDQAFRFIKRRFARIYTGYWPYLVIALVILGLFDPAALARKDLAASVLLTPLPIPERVIPVSWTLTFELYFYLLFFALLFLGERAARRFIVVFMGGLALLNLVGVLYLGFYEASYFETVPGLVRLLVSPYVLEFLAGCLVCRLHLASVAGRPLLALAGSLFLFAAGAAYNALVLDGTMQTGFHVVPRVLFFGTAAVLLVHAAAALDHAGIALAPRLSRLLGGSSYSLYLSHTLIFSLFLHLFGEAFPAGRGALGPAVAVTALVVGYSILHYLWIEKPLYALAKRWLGTRA